MKHLFNLSINGSSATEFVINILNDIETGSANEFIVRFFYDDFKSYPSKNIHFKPGDFFTGLLKCLDLEKDLSFIMIYEA